MEMIKIIEYTVELVYNTQVDGASVDDILSDMTAIQLSSEGEPMTMEETLHSMLNDAIGNDTSFRFIEVVSNRKSKRFATITIDMRNDLENFDKIGESLIMFIKGYIEEQGFKNCSMMLSIDDDKVYIGWDNQTVKE